MKVLISDHSADSWVAKQIASAIEQHGLDAFIYGRGIDHGNDFTGRMRDAVSTSDELVVLLTLQLLDRHSLRLQIGRF